MLLSSSWQHFLERLCFRLHQGPTLLSSLLLLLLLLLLSLLLLLLLLLLFQFSISNVKANKNQTPSFNKK